MGASFDGIYTGFVAGEEQIRNIFRFLDTFYKKDVFLIVDPLWEMMEKFMICLRQNCVN